MEYLVARLAGLEPTTSSSAGMRSIQPELQARLVGCQLPDMCDVRIMVPRVGFEPTRPYGHYALNVARLPFRHLGPLDTGDNRVHVRKTFPLYTRSPVQGK